HVQSALHVTPTPHGDPASHCSPTSTDPLPHACGQRSVGLPLMSTTTSWFTHSVSINVSIVASCPSPVHPDTLVKAAENFVSAFVRHAVSTGTAFNAAFA